MFSWVAKTFTWNEKLLFILLNRLQSLLFFLKFKTKKKGFWVTMKHWRIQNNSFGIHTTNGSYPFASDAEVTS